MDTAGKSSSPPEEARIRAAVPGDANAIARLINAAFVVERVAFDGDRINPDGVRALMDTGKFLLAEDSAGLAGCVYVELRGERSYLGLLSVAPALQGKGMGRQLVAAAEEYSRNVGCRAMDLRIVSPRAEVSSLFMHASAMPRPARPHFPLTYRRRSPAITS